MKKVLTIIVASFFLIGCGNSSKNLNNQPNIVTEFLRDISTLENDTNKRPIDNFKTLANEIADEKIVFSADNIKEILVKARDFSSCVIVTANHTIVKIDDLDDCQQSGSWKACMPMCSGYIKRGKLNSKTDYMNNVIGRPDEQERVAFFF